MYWPNETWDIWGPILSSSLNAKEHSHQYIHHRRKYSFAVREKLRIRALISALCKNLRRHYNKNIKVFCNFWWRFLHCTTANFAAFLYCSAVLSNSKPKLGYVQSNNILFKCQEIDRINSAAPTSMPKVTKYTLLWNIKVC